LTPTEETSGSFRSLALYRSFARVTRALSSTVEFYQFTRE
jgi:hypothetical protein